MTKHYLPDPSQRAAPCGKRLSIFDYASGLATPNPDNVTCKQCASATSASPTIAEKAKTL